MATSKIVPIRKDLDPDNLLPIAAEFTVDSFAEAIEFFRQRTNSYLKPTDFWNNVVNRASNCQINYIPPEQVEYLREWIKENAISLVSHDTIAEYEELDRLLKLL